MHLELGVMWASAAVCIVILLLLSNLAFPAENRVCSSSLPVVGSVIYIHQPQVTHSKGILQIQVLISLCAH